MHEPNRDTQIFENLIIKNPTATVLRLPKDDTLIVEAGATKIVITGEGNITIASPNEVSVSTDTGRALNDRNDAPAYAPDFASGQCGHTRLQYDAWRPQPQEFTAPPVAFESCSTGEDDTPSS